MSYSNVGRRLNAGVATIARMDQSELAGLNADKSRMLSVDGDRILARLAAMAEIGRNAEGGINRIAYSDYDLEGRDYVMGLMREAALEIRVDTAGNIIGRRAGAEPGLPPVLAGSHIDSVPGGGIYDGTVGVISAIEVAQKLSDQGVVTRHPLEIVVFQNEEEGLFGSRAISGDLSESDLGLKSQSGKTIREGIQFIGGDPSRLADAQRQLGEIAVYVEYHIEQGPILELEHTSIGIVEGIVGVNRWEVTIDGFTNHAGTTPMDQRKDALLAAARFIDAVNRIVTNTRGLQVGTVGRISVLPGAANVIPGKVSLSLDLRDLDSDKIELLYQEITAEGQQIASLTGTSINFKPTSVQVAALTDPLVRKFIHESTTELGLSSKVMRSGAGHDAQAIARIAPIGMIFIPSIGGISHTPNEFSRPADIINGANVYLSTVLKLDATI